jgi:predicted transglutaminase-like cysteine proteinase
MARQWYILQDNKKYGPYTEEQMRSFIGKGRLKGDTLVWCGGMKDWMRAANIGPFRFYFTEPQARPAERLPPPVGKKLGVAMAAVIIVVIAIASFWVITRIFGQSSKTPNTAAEYKSYVTPNDSSVQATLSYILANKPWYRTEFGAIQEWVSSNITYVSDDDDYWQTPEETLERRKGDCEDFSILLCSLFRAYGIPDNEVFVAVGFDSGGGGHAFLIEAWYSGEKWRVIEPQHGGLFDTDFWAWHTALTYNIVACFNDHQFYGSLIW